jgi:hypothetical protein
MGCIDRARRHLRLFHGRWHLWRVSDQDYATLRRHALPIAEDHRLIVALNLQVPDEERLQLGKTVVALEDVFGPSSPGFDPWKGSFLFPLLLTLGDGRDKGYLIHCHDHKGIVYCPLYRLVDAEPESSELRSYHEPIEQEFSREEMGLMVTHFYCFLLAYGQSLDERPVEPFCRAVDAENLLYGCDGRQFFERR